MTNSPEVRMSDPRDFIYQTLTIQNNTIHNSFVHGVQNFFFSAFLHVSETLPTADEGGLPAHRPS